jgi:MFS family permease
MILFWVLMPEKPNAVKANAGGPKAAGGRDRIPVIAILMILLASVFYICTSGFRLNVSIYVISEHNLGTSVESGLTSSLSTMFGIIAGFAFALLFKVFKKWIVFTGFAIVSVGLFIIVFVTPSLIGVYVGACMIGFGFNMANPYLMGQIVNVTPPRLVPVAISLLAGGLNLGMFLAMDILGFLGRFAGDGLKGVLMVAAIVASICTVLSIFLFAINRKAQPAAK